MNQSALYRCAVVGNPIAHSRSPEIHAQFAQDTGISLQYDRILAHDDADFLATIKRFFADGGRGLNVTVPFKVTAFAACEVLSPYAKAAGAVNTLWLADGKLHGDNTDGRGLVKALCSHHIELQGKKVLLLGAGGAARGAVLPLLEAGAKVSIYNRTHSKALDLAKEYAHFPTPPKALLHDQLAQAFDLIINATSAGLGNEAFDLPVIFNETTAAYEMVYGKETPFLQAAKRFGAPSFDGYSMLMEQARLSFTIWFGEENALES